MRIAQLSRESAVPVATIKYYLREGLLPSGRLTSPNQAEYGPEHLSRLRLVRALLDIGRLPIATIRALLAEIDGPDPNLHQVLGRALRPTAGARAEVPDNGEAAAELAALMARQGWQVKTDAPARQAVAEVIAGLRSLGLHEFLDQLDGYARIAGELAELDFEVLGHTSQPEQLVHTAVVGTVLGDVLIAGLRRLAQQHVSGKRFGQQPG